MRIFYGMLSVPQIIAMDMNNVVLILPSFQVAAAGEVSM